MAAAVPRGLATRGKRLWRGVAAAMELDPAQKELLLEACRLADRLDKLEAELQGGDFTRVEADEAGDYVLKVDSALAAASRDANVLKQLLTALRLPDAASGKKPQFRGARGAQQPSGVKAVSSLDRARAARSS